MKILILLYKDIRFEEVYGTKVNLDDQMIDLKIWDTSGFDDYASYRRMCCRNSNMFLIVFSVVDPVSFDRVLTKWIPEVKHFSPSASIIIVENKTDLRSNMHVLKQLHHEKKQPFSLPWANNSQEK